MRLYTHEEYDTDKQGLYQIKKADKEFIIHSIHAWVGNQ